MSPMTAKAQKAVDIVQRAFQTKEFIPLHEPCFVGKEKEYLNDCIDSTFVSYLGRYVTDLEKKIIDFTGSRYCLTVVNGTAALHMAMIGAGVEAGTEVITQPLTFVATANAIQYCGAQMVFVDVDSETLGMSPQSLLRFFESQTQLKNGVCINKATGRKISACVPVHIFGHPLDIEAVVEICKTYSVPVVEDSAESLGSYRNGKHTGTFGQVGVLSFNGNKIVTCGGGGAVITNDEACFKKLKHITTTAKVPHAWEYFHDEVGYNYRMPNLNAAVALAQFESLPLFLESKRKLASVYAQEFEKAGLTFVKEPTGGKSNYWLNALLLENFEERELFLNTLNKAGVMCRPAWTLIHELPPYRHAQVFESQVAKGLSSRLVNIPSSVRVNL